MRAKKVVSVEVKGTTSTDTTNKKVIPVVLCGIVKAPLSSSGKKTSVTCEVCKKEFANAAHLLGHSRTHTGEKPYACEHCGRAFSYTHHLNRHVRKLHTHRDEKPWKCDLCANSFGEQSSLFVHKRSHSGEKPYECFVCDYKCTTSSNLDKHTKNRHKSGDAFSCHDCMFECTDYASIKAHLKSHIEAKPFLCNQCDFSCMSGQGLASHHRKHLAVAPYKCDMCGKGFKLPKRLADHGTKFCVAVRKVAALPTKVVSKRHTSDLRAKAFKTRGEELKTHSQKHSRQENVQETSFLPFSIREHASELQCEVCDKTFTNRRGLKKHLESHMIGLLKLGGEMNSASK